MDPKEGPLDTALLAVAAGVLIWLGLSGATIELLSALVAFGAARAILRTPATRPGEHGAHSPKPSE